MTNRVFSEILIWLGVLSAITAATTQVAMLQGIRREQGAETANRTELRVVQILYEIHRRLFPHSRLRKINCVSLLLLGLTTVGIIVASRVFR